MLDANILIRAVLGKKVGHLLLTYVDDVDFCAPSAAFADAEAYLPQLDRDDGGATVGVIVRCRLGIDQRLEDASGRVPLPGGLRGQLLRALRRGRHR